MTYDLNSIKRKIEQLTYNKTSGDEKNKVVWFKPDLGEYEVRFLPYKDSNGQPFQEIAYYDSRLLSERRFVAGFQFNIEDPVLELLTELKKDRSKEAWKLWKNLQPKERYYAPVVVRGQEEKGVQIWELSSKLVKDIYTILAHPDYHDEDMMHEETGYDFTVTCSATDKTFNGFKVKEIKLQPRRKPSPLSKDSKQTKAFLEGIPNMIAYFTAQVKEKDEIKVMLENFLASDADSAVTMDVFDETTAVEEQKNAKSLSDDTKSSNGKATSVNGNKKSSNSTKKSIDDAFKDL